MLPQALRIVVPGIVNNIVDLFKDTSLVTIIGLVDLLGAVKPGAQGSRLAGPRQGGLRVRRRDLLRLLLRMSSYSRRLERRLNRHRTGTP